MKKKIIVIIEAFSILIIVLLGIFKLWMNSLNDEGKSLEVKQITNEYLQKMYTDNKFEIVNGPSRLVSFGIYEIKLKDKNDSFMKIKIDFNLKFLDDSILDKTLSNKLDSYLKETFDKKFQAIKGEVIANIDIKNKYSVRKDTLYVHIIDKKEITKREFADITDQVLKGINTNGFELNLLYLDYMHKQNSEYVYSIKIDEGNMTKEDLIPYIETVSKK